MTVAEAIRAAADRLAATSDTARLDAELLMAHALGLSRSDMLLRAMRDPVPASFAALIERRAAHEPVAYITGWTEFYGRRFQVAPGVLIPRSDSEVLVECALAAAPVTPRVLDLGTGSGALLLSVLAEIPNAQGVGVDVSEWALDIARMNADDLGLTMNAAMVPGDWRIPFWVEDLGTFDLVLCNPPYVEADAALDAQVRDYEPHSALFAGPEGLDDYRALIPQVGKLLAPGGIAIFEIGAGQAEAVSALAESSGFSAELRRDLANRPRALVLR